MRDDDLELARRRFKDGSITLEQLAHAEQRVGKHLPTVELLLQRGTPMSTILKEFPEYARTHGERYMNAVREPADEALLHPDYSIGKWLAEAFAFAQPKDAETLARALQPISRNHLLAALSLVYQPIDPQKALGFIQNITACRRANALQHYAAEIAKTDLAAAETFIDNTFTSEEHKREARKRVSLAVCLTHPDYAKEQSKRSVRFQQQLARTAWRNPDLAYSFLKRPTERDHQFLFRNALSDLAIAQRYFSAMSPQHQPDENFELVGISPEELAHLRAGQKPPAVPSTTDINYMFDRAISQMNQFGYFSADWFKYHPELAQPFIARANRETTQDMIDVVRFAVAGPLLARAKRAEAETHIEQITPGSLKRGAYANLIRRLYCRGTAH